MASTMLANIDWSGSAYMKSEYRASDDGAVVDIAESSVMRLSRPFE